MLKNNDVVVCVDGSYLIYYALFGAVKNWSNSSEHKHVLEDVDPDNPPSLLQYCDFVEILETYVAKTLKSVNNIIKYTVFNGATVYTQPMVYLCLDSPLDKNWRMQHYDQYKAHRKLVPQKFKVKEVFSYCRDIIFNKLDVENYFKLKIVQVEAAEGDDIIAVITKNAKASNKYIIASDKDFLQLSDIARQFDLTGKEIVAEEYKGIKPTNKQFLLAKILMGDVSDNIPQVLPRCGYKTAMKLVLESDTLKQLIKKGSPELRQFNTNAKIIAFKNIPEDLEKSIMENV